MDPEKFYQYHQYSLDASGEMAVYQRIRFGKALKLLQKLNKGKLLDVGGGDGQFSKLAERLGLQTMVMDYNRNALTVASQNGLKTLRRDLEKEWGLRDASFDVVYAGEVIEHIFDTEAFLKRCWKALKPSGFLLVTTPNLGSLENRLRLLFGGYPVNACETSLRNGHIHQFTFRELEKLLFSCGFSALTRRTCNVPFPILLDVPKWMKNAAIHLGDRFYKMGGQIIILARKI